MVPGLMPFFASLVALPSYVFNTFASSGTDSATFTFTDQAIGTAAASRLVVVTVGAKDDTANNVVINSATIGGVSAVIDKQDTTNARIVVGVISAVVPTGTTATIVINFSQTTERCQIGVYSLYDLADTNKRAAGSSTYADPSTGTATGVLDNGILILSIAQENTGAFATTGDVTEDSDAAIETIRVSSASGQKTGGDGNMSYSVDGATAHRPQWAWWR